jgi:hypothetical protein
MVPEYLTPLNGGLLSPGQMAAVAHAVCSRIAGAGSRAAAGPLRPARRLPTGPWGRNRGGRVLAQPQRATRSFAGSPSPGLAGLPPLLPLPPPAFAPRPARPGPEVWELELDLSHDQLPGKLVAEAAGAFPNLIGVRIANAYIGERRGRRGGGRAEQPAALAGAPSMTNPVRSRAEHASDACGRQPQQRTQRRFRDPLAHAHPPPSGPRARPPRPAPAGGSDAAQLSRALLSCAGLARLQLQGCLLDTRGCAALARLLSATPTLAQLDLTTCRLRGAAGAGAGAPGVSCCGGGGARCAPGGACLPCCLMCCGRGERERRKAAVALARGIRENRTLRQVRTQLGRGAGHAQVQVRLRGPSRLARWQGRQRRAAGLAAAALGNQACPHGLPGALPPARPSDAPCSFRHAPPPSPRPTSS